jgi:hypothetical protein
MIGTVDRPTTQARFASKFRSRTDCLPTDVAKALISAYTAASKKADWFASRYEQTLPFLPDIIDRERKKTRIALLSEFKPKRSCR